MPVYSTVFIENHFISLIVYWAHQIDIVTYVYILVHQLETFHSFQNYIG